MVPSEPSGAAFLLRICPALSIIFTARAGNGLLWVAPLLHWGVDKLLQILSFYAALLPLVRSGLLGV
jgi:hypothetical protein